MKKLLQRILLKFGYVPRKMLVQNLELVVIDNTNTITTNFGISEERANEMIDLLIECDIHSSNYTDGLHFLSKHVKHQNELAVIVYLWARHKQQQENPFSKLLTKLIP